MDFLLLPCLLVQRLSAAKPSRWREIQRPQKIGQRALSGGVCGGGSHIASADRGWGWVFWIPNCLLCSGMQAGLPANTHRFLGTASEVSLWDRCIWEAPLTLKDYGGGGSGSSLQQRTCFLFCNSGYKMCRRPASDQRRSTGW